jgi:integrase
MKRSQAAHRGRPADPKRRDFREHVRRLRLTDARLGALEPEAREFTVWAEDPRRLGVRVLPSGAKVYVLRLRQDRAQRWVTIGRHGDGWDVRSATTRAHELLGLHGQGAPVHRLKAMLAGIPSLRRAAVLYLRDRRAYLKPGSLDRLRTSLLHVVRRLGKVRVDQLTADDVATFHGGMKATPIAANRALVALHGLMKFAQRKSYRHDNPAKGIHYYREKARERYLTEDETARLARALAEAEGKESPFVLAAVKLILLTGCRQGEVFGLRWSEVDLERGVIRLEDAKTGARVVYLNELAQDVLTALPRIEGNPHVVPGWKKGTHYQGEQKAWERIRAAAGMPDLRLHDLRHNYASVLASGGASLQMIGALLGHKRVATTARYAHLVDSALRDLTEKVSTALQAVAVPPPRGKVLPHRRTR